MDQLTDDDTLAQRIGEHIRSNGNPRFHLTSLHRSPETPSPTSQLEIIIAAGPGPVAEKMHLEKNLLKMLGDVPAQIRFRPTTPRPKMQPQDSPASPRTPFGFTRNPRKLSGVKAVVAVASGKGGVGKSTVTTHLAAALVHGLGLRVGILDADLYGPSIPVMLGQSRFHPSTNPNTWEPAESHGIRWISFGMLATEDEPVIWRGPLISKGFSQLCFATNWGELDMLLLDLPPGTGDIQITMIEQLQVDAALVVTTPQHVATADAARALKMFRGMGTPVLGIVENMAYLTCSHCGQTETIFGHGGGEQLSERYQIPVIGHLPFQAAVQMAGDGGRPVSTQPQHSASAPYLDLARRVAAHPTLNRGAATSELPCPTP